MQAMHFDDKCHCLTQTADFINKLDSQEFVHQIMTQCQTFLLLISFVLQSAFTEMARCCFVYINIQKVMAIIFHM